MKVVYLATMNRAKIGVASKLRRFSTAILQRIEDEGDWFYSSEWWDSDPGQSTAQTVFREVSDKGNGVVSVLAHPSSRPLNDNPATSSCIVNLFMESVLEEALSRLNSEIGEWVKTETWLNQRYGDFNPTNGNLRILGYQWRTLHFNDVTRQSTVKVMAACREHDPKSVLIMQQPHCIAVPYVKSNICAGLTALVASRYDLKSAVVGKKRMNILCIGHGGGSIPLFLASKIQGAVVHIVEIDPVVISASTKAMGFPSFSLMTSSGKRASPSPDPVDEMLWKGTHERLLLYEADAEKFITDSTTLYDIVYMDAYDGEDIFPRKLWDPQSPFLRALSDRLHPKHGTVIVNLHSDVDPMTNSSVMGRYVSGVTKAYKDVLLENGSADNSGLAFTLAVPWVCNTCLVVCRGLGEGYNRDLTINRLVSRSHEVESLLDLNFSCLAYMKRGFDIV